MQLISRRRLLKSTVALSTTSFSGLVAGCSKVGTNFQKEEVRDLIRDHLWIFTGAAGMTDHCLE